MHRKKAQSDSERSKVTDDDAVKILNDVKAFGRGEVLFKISDGEIRKALETKAH